MTKPKTPNAIEMLESQHRDVEQLFEQIESAEGQEKQRLFNVLADSLAVHATIEERIFYPTVKANRTEDILLESLEEHLAIKRILADLLTMSVEDETFDAKLTVLQEQIEHHVEEEESDLFPKVERLFDEDTLDAIASEMVGLQTELEAAGSPRKSIPQETEEAAPLP